MAEVRSHSEGHGTATGSGAGELATDVRQSRVSEVSGRTACQAGKMSQTASRPGAACRGHLLARQSPRSACGDDSA